MFDLRFIKTAAAIATVLTFVTVLSMGCGTKAKPTTAPGAAKEVAGTTSTESKPAAVETKEVKMDAAMKKKLNTFFSNFSEAYVTPFEKGRAGDENLIRFGVLHVILNSEKLIEYKGADKNTGYIKAENVDGAALYFFGKKPSKHFTVDDFIYENGSYKFPRASGEMYTFSQIDKLYDLGSNNYKAEVSIYNASSGFSGDPHGTMNDWKAKGESPELSKKINAVIQKVTENGQDRYLLLEYK